MPVYREAEEAEEDFEPEDGEGEEDFVPVYEEAGDAQTRPCVAMAGDP